MNDPIKKTPPKQVSNNNLIEQLRDIGRGTAKTIKSDLIGGIGQDALSSLFGTPKSGSLKPNEPVNINHTPQNPSVADRFPQYNPQNMPEMYPPFPFRRREQFVSQFSQENLQKLKQQEVQVQQKIEEVRLELKALIAAIKNVDSEIRQAVDEQLIDPGQYHLNFLDRLKTILKLMRQNLNNSSSWLAVMRSRKKNRSYWAMYKKKGTEFGLNNERVVATQVG